MRGIVVGIVTLSATGVRAEVTVDDGIVLTATYTGEVFTAPDLDETVVAGLAELALDLDLATMFDAYLGAVHVNAFGIHGEGLAEELMGIAVSNIEAEPEVRLQELWIEQPIGPFTIRAGLLAADEEFVIVEQSASLVAATFGIIGMYTANVGRPLYPIATPAASARFEDGRFAARAAFYADPHDDHGIPHSLGEDVVGFGEVQLGALKLGGWHHTVLGSGGYGIVDHAFDTRTGMFARAAYGEGPITLYADAGVRAASLSLGLAFGRSDEAGPQTLVEATYRVELWPWLALQPVAQLVMIRSGTEPVVGLRVTVEL